MSYAARTVPFPEPAQFANAGMHNGRRLIVLTRSLVCITSHGLVIVPAGFVCDGASIPRLAQSIIGHPFDEYLEDTILHDYLYDRASDDLGLDRWSADDILKETMWNRRFPLWKTATFHIAVSAFGGSHFKQPGSPSVRV